MTILPIDPTANASPQALLSFLDECRGVAVRDGRPKLVSISVSVDALDPLAVLESIFEPSEQHFYAERAAAEVAIAGAESVVGLNAEGPDRFARVQQFVDDCLAHTIAVGEVGAPFGGPHFFAAFGFVTHAESGAPYPAASVFLPRWQVARAGSRTTAVANLLIDRATPVALLAEKVWRAHGKFRAFEYAAPEAPRADGALTYRWLPDEPNAYENAVARALRRIAAGELEKIVLARRREVTASEPLHPLQMLNGLRQRYADCYAFSVANGRGQSFIGASPERLARVSDGQLETEALAGSAPRGTTATEDARLGAGLVHSAKDRREHRVVLEAITAQLRSLGLDLTHPVEPGLKRLANVQHLHTPIRAALTAETQLLDVLGRLHPTPAVGGTPRDAAMAAIRELENFSRGLYAGALGWLDARGGGEFFVGLRSALVDGQKAQFFAGAGIVAGSSPDQEYAETELKLRAMLEALQPASANP